MSFESRMVRASTVAAFCATALGLTGCTRGADNDTVPSGATNSPQAGEVVTVGFVGIGPEGPWRAANEASIQNSFTKEAGFDLKYAPSTNLDQNSQVSAFTTFVDDGVDVILLAPAEASGWSDALRLAQEAQIPVILIDGGIVPDDSSLYVTRIESDNTAIGATVADWAVTAFPDGAGYFILEGPSGTDIVTQRDQGWESVMADHPEFKKIGAQSANWSADEARLVTEAVLGASNNLVPLILAQNDEMGLGALLAVEAAGLTPGVDVKIATIGGNKGALQALIDGRLSFVEEYNPIFGPTAVDVVNTVLKGGTVASSVIVPSKPFASITQEELDAREY